MKVWYVVAALCAAVWSGGGVAQEAGYRLLEPVRDRSGHALEQVDGQGRRLPVVRPVTDKALESRIRAVLAQGVPALLPALDEQARAASAYRPVCPAWQGGITLYLSDDDGGYARQGLYVETRPGQRALCTDSFIDITVDPTSLANGEFEEVLVHEYGHVLLRRLLGPVPATPSRQAHAVFAVTDDVTAFDEGFGEHWQPVVARFTRNAGFRARVEGVAPPSAAELWLSRRDTWWREHGVPHNAFVFQPSVPAGAPDDAQRWLAAETSWPADACRMKGGNAMMASEGVAASFFYRLLGAGQDPAALARRYAQLVPVLARMGRWPGRAPLVALVHAWGEQYPRERKAVTQWFLASTYGATASVAMHDQAESLSCLGARGKLGAFVPALKTFRHDADALLDQVVSGRLALDAALAPPLWLASKDVRVSDQIGASQPDQPLVVDLNTAEAPALQWLLGDEMLVRRLLEARRQGGFRSLPDAVARAKLSASQQALLEEVSANYRALPPYTRS
jgi:hypothetical protein